MGASKEQSGIKIDRSEFTLTAEQIDEKTKNFKELLEKEMEETIDQFEEELNRPMESQTEEIARTRLQLLKNKLTALKGLYQKALDEYHKSVKAGHTNLEQLSRQLREEISKQTKTKLANLKAVLDLKTGATISTREVRDLEKAFTALEEFEKQHPQLQPIFEKISKNQKLTKNENGIVAGLIKPSSAADKSKSALDFETTAAGLLISLMKPDKRYSFMEDFMEGTQAAKTPNLIDMFLSNGTLTRIQGEKLFKVAIDKGLIGEERFNKDFKQKLESGFYEKEVAKMKELISKELKEKYVGRYADNELNRFVGAPMLGALMTLWGGTTALFNLLANRGEGFSATIEKFITGGYGPIGLATALAGTEIFSGSLKQGKATEWLGLGSGWIGEFYHSPGEDVEVARKKEESAKEMADIYLNTHKSFAEYLENGGSNTMKTLSDELAKTKQENQLLSVDGLLKYERDADQKKRLMYLKNAATLDKDELSKRFTSFAVHTAVLGLRDNHQVLNFLEHVRNAQFSS